MLRVFNGSQKRGFESFASNILDGSSESFEMKSRGFEFVLQSHFHIHAFNVMGFELGLENSKSEPKIMMVELEWKSE